MMRADTADRPQEQFGRILDLLDTRAPRGQSVSEIARTLKMSRNSAAKYLDILAASGSVRLERFGRSKLYHPSSHIPFTDLFDRLPNAIVILDGDLKVLMANASFLTTLGIRHGRSLIGASLLNLELPVFAEAEVRRNIEGIRDGGQHLDTMELTDEMTGRIYEVEFASVVSPVAGPGIMVSLRDLTATRKADTALRNAERKVATLFETVPSGIIIFAADGTILNANPASLAILGLTRFEQLSTVNVFALPCVPATLEELIARGRTAEIELAFDFDRMREKRVLTSRSGVAYFNVVFTPIPREGGDRPDEFAMLFKDITRDREERKDLTFRETRYHGFFEDTCNGVLILERTGTDTYIFKDLNRAAEAFLRVRKEDLVGRPVLDVFPDLDVPAANATAQQVVKTGTPAFIPPLRYREDEDLWVWHYLFALPSGELASFMIDISREVRSGAHPFAAADLPHPPGLLSAPGPDPIA
jgi:PAS domain S-box-containing protein